MESPNWADPGSPLEPENDAPCIIGGRVISDRTFHRVSRALLAARIRAHLMQGHVADRMGTTTSAVSRLENAAGHPPSLRTLSRYAEAVGCRLDVRLIPLT